MIAPSEFQADEFQDLDDEERPLGSCRPLGWTLLAIAALIVIPIAAFFGSVFG